MAAAEQHDVVGSLLTLVEENGGALAPCHLPTLHEEPCLVLRATERRRDVHPPPCAHGGAPRRHTPWSCWPWSCWPWSCWPWSCWPWSCAMVMRTPPAHHGHDGHADAAVSPGEASSHRPPAGWLGGGTHLVGHRRPPAHPRRRRQRWRGGRPRHSRFSGRGRSTAAADPTPGATVAWVCSFRWGAARRGRTQGQ
jgi:hypothetical protein